MGKTYRYNNEQYDNDYDFKRFKNEKKHKERKDNKDNQEWQKEKEA